MVVVRAFRVSSPVLACLSILALVGCVEAQAFAQSNAQSNKDRVTATPAGSKRQFLAFVPHGRNAAITLGHATEPDDPSQINSIPTFSGELRAPGVCP